LHTDWARISSCASRSASEGAVLNRVNSKINCQQCLACALDERYPPVAAMRTSAVSILVSSSTVLISSSNDAITSGPRAGLLAWFTTKKVVFPGMSSTS